MSSFARRSARGERVSILQSPKRPTGGPARLSGDMVRAARNGYIVALVEAGMAPKQVAEDLHQFTGVSSVRQVDRIVADHRRVASRLVTGSDIYT